MLLRCPFCKPKYRVARTSKQRLGWVVREDYVGYLVTHRYEGMKRPPVACPDCGSALVRTGDQSARSESTPGHG